METRGQGEAETHLDVVVLASGVNAIPLYEGYVPGYKSLIPFRGRASVHYTLDALDALPEIRNICVEGPPEELERELADRRTASGGGRIRIIEGGSTFLDSLAIGLKHFHASRSVLFITADAPLIRPSAVREFLAGCAAATPTGYEHDLFVSVAPRTSFTGPYRGFTKPFNTFRDVAVCHGNLFLLSPKLLDNQDLRERVNRMYARRKNVLSVVEAFGWKVALTYVIGAELLHVVTLKQMADMASRRLGIGIVPVLVADPDVTMDVDEADDYEFVRDRLEERAGAPAGASGSVTERLVRCN